MCHEEGPFYPNVQIQEVERHEYQLQTYKGENDNWGTDLLESFDPQEKRLDRFYLYAMRINYKDTIRVNSLSENKINFAVVLYTIIC